MRPSAKPTRKQPCRSPLWVHSSRLVFCSHHQSPGALALSPAITHRGRCAPLSARQPSQPFPEMQTSPCRPPQLRLHISPTAIGQPPPPPPPLHMQSQALHSVFLSPLDKNIGNCIPTCFASPQPPVSRTHACRANVVFDSHVVPTALPHPIPYTYMHAKQMIVQYNSLHHPQ